MEKKKTRIKIIDLPKEQKVSQEEMKKIFGGIITSFQPSLAQMFQKYETENCIAGVRG
jgi:hypothetical protein